MISTNASVGEPGAHLKCEGLWKVFGRGEKKLAEKLKTDGPQCDPEVTPAVKSVSLEVKPAETLVVMGLSGSGKSTLVRMMTRLIEPTAGQVFLDDACVTTMSSAQLRQFRRTECAMVFQHFGLFPHLKVWENAAYGLTVCGVPRSTREARAREVLELVGLADWGDRHPGELSGGMKQRVGLARALVVDPRLLLFDEPFSALDPLIRRDLQDELLRLRKEVAKTMVFITHDMSEALKLGDRIAIMRQGEIVQNGTPEDIVLSPANDYVRSFVRDAPRGSVIRAGTVAQQGLTFAATTPPVEVLNAMADAQQASATIVDTAGRPVNCLTWAQAHLAAQRGIVDYEAARMPTISVNSHLDEIVSALTTTDVGVVAVVDDAGVLHGVANAQTVLRALATADAGSRERTTEHAAPEAEAAAV